MEILFNSPDNYLTLISNQVEAGISLLVNNGAVHIEVCIYLYLLRYLQISTIPSMSQGHHIPVSLSSLTLVQPRALNLTSNVFRAEVAARFAAGEYVTISRGVDGDISASAANRSIGSTTGCTIMEKAPTRAFSWLKAPTSAFTFKTLC